MVYNVLRGARIINFMKISAFLLFLLYPLVLHGQGLLLQSFTRSPLRDPRIPSGEESSYVTWVNDTVQYSRTIVRILEDENAYQFQDNDGEQEITLVVSRAGFIPIRNETITRNDKAEYSETTSIARAPRLGIDEVLVLSFTDLPYLLRAYPFSNPETLTVYTLDQSASEEEDEGESFSIQVEYRGSETVTANVVEYNAHKLEIVFKLPGIAAIFAGAIPKTYLWYEARPPHRLVRYEGPTDFNFGGETKTFVTELVRSRILSD